MCVTSWVACPGGSGGGVFVMGWGVDSAFVFVWMALQVGVRRICGVGAGQSKMVGGGEGRQRLGPVGGAVQVASAALAAGTPVGDGGDTGGIARRESRDGRRLWPWVLGVGLYRGLGMSCHVPAWLSFVLYSRMGMRTHACLCSLMLWMGWHPDCCIVSWSLSWSWMYCAPHGCFFAVFGTLRLHPLISDTPLSLPPTAAPNS